jgi:type IV pilus assembly protein PilA
MLRKEQGFTLIELLVVVAIIGILAAIAIPQFQAYRQRGYDASAKSDLRNASTAEEAYFIDHNTYVSCDTTTCLTELDGLKGISKTVTLEMTGLSTNFTGSAASTSGTTTFTWNALEGGLQ